MLQQFIAFFKALIRGEEAELNLRLTFTWVDLVALIIIAALIIRLIWTR